MEDCTVFEDRLKNSVPYPFRYDAENTLQSFVESRIMLQVFADAIKALPNINICNGSSPLIVAFGSYGRLDGSTVVSDYDTIFLYEGERNETHITAIKFLIKEVISSNKALRFDHRDEIENDTFDFDTSPAYPIYSFQELLSNDDANSRIRAMQIITEGRAINGKDRLLNLQEQILRNRGFSTSRRTVNLNDLRGALTELKDAFCNTILGHLRTDRRPITNHKILKLFALREYSYLATLFSIAEICFTISVNQCNHGSAAQMLSSPSVLKISSFADSTGALAQILGRMSPQINDSLTQLVGRHVRTLSLESKLLNAGRANRAAAGVEFFDNLRALVLDVLSKYDNLINLLHDKEYITLIEGYDTNVAAWISNQHFRQVLDGRTHLLDAIKNLANALAEIVDGFSDNVQCTALTDARQTLEAIKNYQLGLSSL